jgi:alpha-tubulin suppressor-like RCC1 family protein
MVVLPKLANVVSRKTHGATGTFDLILDRTQSIGGSITVEPRAIGSGHKIVFQFDVPVTFGVATAIDEAGASVVVASAVAGGNNDVVVTLTGLPDNKRVKVSLSNVNGADFSASLGFLLGDVNNSRSITPNDIQQTKSHSGQMADAINFGSDLNATGAVTAADIVAIKSRTPRTLVQVAVQPPFTTQPASITITEGQSAQFTVATSGNPAPTLQWQLSTDNGANWSNIAGAINNVLNVVAATLANNGRQYRVVATFIAGPLASNAATLTVNPAIIIPASAGKITAGPDHTCAVKADGTVACWGKNSRREVTPSNGFNQDVPVVVPGLAGMTQVAVGFQHSCAIDGTGALLCWGGNQTSVATIKDGSNVNYTGVKGVALGNAHTCFIDSLTNVLCWGDNSVGQLGQGNISAAFVTTPVFVQRVTGVLTGVISLSAGDFHTCALTSGGDVVCWGRGAIGDGRPALPGFESIGTQLATTAAVPAVTGAKGMTSGLSHACAAMVAGGVKCWGYNNRGQLGNGNTTSQLFPVTVSDPAGLLTGATILAAQSANSCALSANGRVACWGAVLPGSVNGINTYQPTAQGSTTGLTALVSGGAHSCALTGVGGMECWGANQNGQLGVGGTIGVITGGPAPPQSTVTGGAIFWK